MHPFYPANNSEMHKASPAEAGRDPTLRVFYNQKSLAISKITKKCQMHFRCSEVAEDLNKQSGLLPHTERSVHQQRSNSTTVWGSPASTSLRILPIHSLLHKVSAMVRLICSNALISWLSARVRMIWTYSPELVRIASEIPNGNSWKFESVPGPL